MVKAACSWEGGEAEGMCADILLLGLVFSVRSEAENECGKGIWKDSREKL